MKIMQNDRKKLLSVLAKSSKNHIVDQWKSLNISTDYKFLKKPEIGMVMVRARAAGHGENFNMGEMTVTRCVVQLDSNEIGYGYTAGREKEKSKLIAIIDALFQKEAFRDVISSNILQPLIVLQEKKETHNKIKTDTSKVNFFTMVRGD
jgi:alpha-D-ribose 1-methylphosphonate 5-triphosphate synthase subunit PhnG